MCLYQENKKQNKSKMNINNTREMTSSELQNLTWVKRHPVRARLLDAQLWSEFLAINNEMIVTKTGRLVRKNNY